MRIPIAAAVAFLLLQLLTDAYILFKLRRRNAPKSLQYAHIGIFLLFLAMWGSVIFMPRKSVDDAMLVQTMWMLFSYLTVYIAKIIYILFDIIASAPHLWHAVRWAGLSHIGAWCGVTVFAAMWWGALINRNSIEVTHISIPINNLPKSFEGYKIAQISDLHTGTFGTDTVFLNRLTDSIIAQRPNLVVFTGDIVNRHSSELRPFINTLSRITAPDGVISILGNHDYGDYYNWNSAEDKENNMQELYNAQARMGWRLLRNNTEYIVRGTDSLAIIGVENWGEAPFPTYGRLDIAYPTLSDSITKVLLSHNPRHWETMVEPFPDKNIALTLSGHTHAMQMELFGFSPAQWRYRLWGGLYQDHTGSRWLYVNIGDGTVGIPMRLGATPEISVLTLTGIQGN